MARVFNIETGADYVWGGSHEFDGLVDFDAGFKVAAAQEAVFYNTADETTNYERGFARWAANVWTLGTEKGVGGNVRPISVTVGGTPWLYADSTTAYIQGEQLPTHMRNCIVPDDYGFTIGSASFSDALLSWRTVGNDHLVLGLGVGSATQSGNFIICESADYNVDFGHAASADPRLIIQSADATTVADYWSVLHNQTDALMQVGAGDLLIAIAGGNLAPSTNDGWALGVAATGEVSDVFLALGAVLNFDNSAASIAHTAPAGVNTLTWTSTVGYITLGGNQGLAFQLQEGANSYIGVSTSTGTEQIYFGNATTNPDYVFNGSGYTQFNGNVGVGTATFGTNAAGVLALSNGATAPSDSANLVHIYAADAADTNAALAVWAEDAVNVTGDVVATHTVPFIYNGVEYRLLATNA